MLYQVVKYILSQVVKGLSSVVIIHYILFYVQTIVVVILY